MFSFVPATVGALFAALSTYPGETWTLQPTAASQKYLPPPGFQAWDGGPVTPSTSVWSAADASANGMTLTNGGLTVTKTGGGWASIRNNINKNAGKLYVEFFLNSNTSGYLMLGLASAGFDPTSYLGASAYSGGIYATQNFVSSGFTSNYTNNLSGPVTNDVWALAIDFTAGSIWVAQNNIWANSSNPATGSLPVMNFIPATVGALFAGMSLNAAGDQGTLQATAASQKYLPPPGFQAWDGGPVTPSTSVWSASDAAAGGMTLSNGGLTVVPGTAGWDAIRGSISKSSGKVYFEVATSAATTSNFIGIGLANAGFPPANYLGAANYSVGSHFNGAIYGSGFTPIVGYPAGDLAAGDVLGVTVDFGAGQLWFAYNNVWVTGNPATAANPSATFTPATVGALFPTMAFNTGGPTGGGVWTLQPSAASQKYAPPSGFTAWDASAPTHSPQALAYLARTVGGNEGGNGTNIATLIDGLVSDGVWAKLDALYIFAQQNATDALLNLIGTSYTITTSVLRTPPTFTAYQGFNSNGAGYLNSGFIASTAPSPNYVLNNASFGIWAYAITAEVAAQISTVNGPSSLYNNYTGSGVISRVNSSAFVNVATSITRGLMTGERTVAANAYVYQNGVSAGAATSASSAVDTSSFWFGYNSNQTLCAAFIGASLGSAGQLALYNRLRTYMTSIGVP